jgi:hypothetical protein
MSVESETHDEIADEVINEVPRSRIEKAILSYLPEDINEIQPSVVTQTPY